MTLYELADLLRRDIVARRYENQTGRIGVCLEYCEIKEDGGLLSLQGNGKTWEEAVSDYARQISGKRLVFDAYGKDRAEFQCPILTE